MLLKPNVGRALSAIGAVVVALSLFIVWYHVTRSVGQVDDTTGWQTFTRLRLVILGGAIVTLITALIAQSRGVLVVRAIVGLAIALLIARRIVSPPDVGLSVKSAVGVYAGVVGALMVAAGALVDTGRRVIEVYPNLWRPPVAELGRGRQTLDQGDESRRP